MAEDNRIDTAEKEKPEDFPVTLRQRLAELENKVTVLAAKDNTLVVAETQPAAAAMALPVMSIADLQARDQFIKDVIENFFVQDVHYGVPFPNAKDPKTGKPILMLLKTGAEWFASAFGVRPEFEALVSTVERGDAPFVFFRYVCNLHLVRTDQIVGSAEGVCTSEEDKYKYRTQNYTCPLCGVQAIRKSRFPDKQTGDIGWYCNKRDNGCGANFASTDPAITDQPEPGRSLNTEVLGLSHTIESMAQKRAFVAAVRATFGLSAYIKLFEGMDDVPEMDEQRVTIEGQAAPKSTPAPAANGSRPKSNGTKLLVTKNTSIALDWVALNFEDLKTNAAAYGAIKQMFGWKSWADCPADLTFEDFQVQFTEKRAVAAAES